MAYVDGLLAQGERVIVTAHRHVLFVVGRVVIFVLVGLVLVGAGAWAASAVSILLGGSLWLLALVPFGIALVRYLSWRTEEYVVTNYRIIQTEGLFNKRILDSSLEKVNDILLTQSLIGRLFNFGTIQIITASEVGVNRLDALHDPFAFKRAIVDARNDLYDHDRDDQPARSDQTIRLLAALEELRGSGLITEAEYEIKRERLLRPGVSRL